MGSVGSVSRPVKQCKFRVQLLEGFTNKVIFSPHPSGSFRSALDFGQFIASGELSRVRVPRDSHCSLVGSKKTSNLGKTACCGARILRHGEEKTDDLY